MGVAFGRPLCFLPRGRIGPLATARSRPRWKKHRRGAAPLTAGGAAVFIGGAVVLHTT